MEYNGSITSDNCSTSGDDGYHATDPDDSEVKVLDSWRMVSTSRNLYNLAGCARSVDESCCSGDTRTVYGAITSVDETYVDPVHFGYDAMTPGMSGECHVGYRHEPIVLIKIPNTVGSSRLNATIANFESKWVPDAVVENTVGSIASYPGSAVR